MADFKIVNWFINNLVHIVMLVTITSPGQSLYFRQRALYFEQKGGNLVPTGSRKHCQLFFEAPH